MSFSYDTVTGKTTSTWRVRVERLEDLPAYVQEQVRRQHPEIVSGAKPKGVSRYQVAPIDQRTADQIVFDSKGERLLYERLVVTLAVNERLAIHARFPLVALVGKAGKVPSSLSVDFTIWTVTGERLELIEAYDRKPRSKKGVAPGWKRGAAAFASTFGIRIIEVTDPARFVRGVETR